jgi:hypothetical protein
MTRINVAAIVAVLLGFIALGLIIWRPETESARALVIGLLALVAAVLSFRE